MYQPLIEAMENYFAAGQAMNIEGMDALYAEDFTNIRTDKAGQSATITKDQFMTVFKQMKAAGQSHGASTDDVTYLATSLYDGLGSLLLRRNENDTPAIYNFVWRLDDGKPTQLVREFSVEEDISDLLAAIRASQNK